MLAEEERLPDELDGEDSKQPKMVKQESDEEVKGLELRFSGQYFRGEFKKEEDLVFPLVLHKL